MPKNRRKVLYGKVRKYLGPVFHQLAGQRECKIIKGSMIQGHVHMLIQIPPKHSVAEVVGYIKGKSAIAVARQFGDKKKNFSSGLEGMLFQRNRLRKYTPVGLFLS